MDRKVDSGKLDLGAAGPAALQVAVSLAVFHDPMIALGEEIIERDIGWSLHSSYALHLCSAVPFTYEQYHCRRQSCSRTGMTSVTVGEWAPKSGQAISRWLRSIQLAL
jgi:hypothetical protein